MRKVKWLRYSENQASSWVTEKSFDIEEAGIVTLILIAPWKGKSVFYESISLSELDGKQSSDAVLVLLHFLMIYPNIGQARRRRRRAAKKSIPLPMMQLDKLKIVLLRNWTGKLD